MDATTKLKKDEILRKVTKIEKRLDVLRNRKLVSTNWQEHNILRFQMIDDRHERTRLLSQLEN
jgi:hypothetical protein